MSETFDRALAALPHGSEFRFVDRLLALEPGRRGVGEYTVRGDEAFLRGHFPGQPLVPGVILAEALAQVAGIAAQSDPAIPPLQNLRLTALQRVKITGTAEPGETIEIEASVTARLANLIQATGKVRVGGRIILTGDIALSGDAA